MDIEKLPGIPSNGEWVLKGQNGLPYWRDAVIDGQMISVVGGATGISGADTHNVADTNYGCIVSASTSGDKYPNTVRAFGEDRTYIVSSYKTGSNDKITKNGTAYRMLACQKTTTGTVTWMGKNINLAGLNPTSNPMELICVTTSATTGYLADVDVSEKDLAIIIDALYYKKILMFSNSATGGITNHFPEINTQLYNIVDVVKNANGTLSWLMLVLKTSPVDIVYDSNETWTITAPVQADVTVSGMKNGGQVNIGTGNSTTADLCTAIGCFNAASSQGSVSIGCRNTADSRGLCIGDGNMSGAYGITIGAQNSAAGTSSIGIGRMLLVGNISKNNSQQIALGTFNKWDPNAFIMFADGADKNNRTNVMTVGAVETNKDSNIMLADSSHNMFQANLPKPPTTAGNYRLRCSVASGGAVTYSWVSDS